MIEAASKVVVSLETAVLVAVLMFVLGFFSNLLAMKKMFTAKSEFQEYKAEREKLALERQRIREEAEKSLKLLFESLCESKRASCAPMIQTLSKMQGDVAELFRLIREGHGKIERLIGLVESKLPNINGTM